MELDSRKTQTYFHERARKFDSLYEDGSGIVHLFNRTMRRGIYDRVAMTVQEFSGLQDFSVLDVGCGSGRNSVIFAKMGAARVLGVDFADNMIALARQYSRDAGVVDKCEFIKDDVFNCQISGKFDAAVALGIFDYLENPRPLLQRMKELSNGLVIGSFPGLSLLRAPLRKFRYSLRNCPVYFFSRASLERACQDVGLNDFILRPCASSGWLLVGRV